MNDRIIRKLTFYTAAVSVCLAGAALAQPPGGPGRGPGGAGRGPADPAAIAAVMSAQGITETTVDPGGKWTVGGRNGPEIRLWAVIALKDPNGQARVALRYEYLTPAAGVAGGPQALSRMDRIDVDCNGQRVRVLSAQTYTQHNFQGQKTEVGAPNAPWEPASGRPLLAGAIQLACSQTSTQTAAVSAAPFDIKDERATRRWLNDNHITETNVDNTRWQLMGVTPQGVFFSPQAVVRYISGARNVPVLIIRMERFQPIAKLNGQGTTLSEEVYWEINCTNRQTHRSQLKQYEQHNLTGTAATSGTRDGWIPAAQDPMVGSMYQEVCQNAEQKALDVKDRPIRDDDN